MELRVIDLRLPKYLARSNNVAPDCEQTVNCPASNDYAFTTKVCSIMTWTMLITHNVGAINAI